MRMYDLIDKKRNGFELTEQELEYLINGYVSGEIPDYQMSAFLMAVCFNGMTDDETACMTSLMAKSGDMLDLSQFGDDAVDKHSTGGVGDKTTLIVAPIVASLGCTVAKLSGRGLGHTGGTLDKLESIKGYNINLSGEAFMLVAKECGVCVCGAGKNLVPADKKLYALRDVTATVRSIPLIVASIMSKKLAGGARSIVLDVKTGSGAFMKTLDEAKELAKGMVSIGKLSDRKVSAVITNMDKPLGFAIGNSLEVAEAVRLLKGDENADENLKEVCVTLSAELVSISKNLPFDECALMVNEVLKNGKAYNKFLEWIKLQNGDVSVFDDIESFASAEYKTEFLAENDGFIYSCDAEGLGVSAMLLGAGRATKDDVIDPTAGIIQISRVGDRVKKGDVIAILQSSTVSDFASAKKRLAESITISETAPESKPLIYEIVR